MTLRRAAALSVGTGAIGAYMHSRSPRARQDGVLVGLESKADPVELAIFGKKLAMHIAASNPLAVDAKASTLQPLRASATCLPKRRRPRQAANVVEKSSRAASNLLQGSLPRGSPYVHDAEKTVAQA